MTFISTPKQEEGGTRKTNVVDLSTKELLIEAVMLLRKIEYHLSIGSDTSLKDYEITGE